MICIFRRKKEIVYIKGDDDIIARDTYLNFTCSKCKYSENIPDWIVGELNAFSFGRPSMECPKCNGKMFRTKTK